MFLKIILGIEILAALFGTFYFYKYRNTSLKPWIILLYLAPLAEITGEWYSNNVNYNNHIIFNIYGIINQLILLKIIFDLIAVPQYKKAILWIMGVSGLLFVVNSSYASVVTDFLTLSESAGTILLIIALAIYLIDTLKNDNILKFRNNLAFIVFSGYMIFSIVYLPIFFAFQYLVDMKTGGETLYPVLLTVQGSAIIVMNMLFIFGVLWTQPNLKHILV